MVQMMNRSIDILEDLAEESGNRVNLNRRGYLFATADPARIEEFKTHAREAESLKLFKWRGTGINPMAPT
jgi:hypothetical protein